MPKRYEVRLTRLVFLFFFLFDRMMDLSTMLLLYFIAFYFEFFILSVLMYEELYHALHYRRSRQQDKATVNIGEEDMELPPV